MMLLRAVVLVPILAFPALIVGCGPSVEKKEELALSQGGKTEMLKVEKTTRFKDKAVDKSALPVDDSTNCTVKAGTSLKLKSRPTLAGDKRHYLVQLAETLSGCTMTTGYFYGPHLYGDSFRVDETPQAGSSGATSQTQNGEYNASLGQRLVQAAWRSSRSGGRCYAEVAWSLHKAGIVDFNDYALWNQIGAQSAYMFAEWANANPSKLYSRFKYKRVDTAGTRAENAPAGSIIVYQPGDCGYNRAHGHIEIAMGNGTACSDFCQTIPRSCGRPSIYVPVY